MQPMTGLLAAVPFDADDSRRMIFGLEPGVTLDNAEGFFWQLIASNHLICVMNWEIESESELLLLWDGGSALLYPGELTVNRGDGT